MQNVTVKTQEMVMCVIQCEKCLIIVWILFCVTFIAIVKATIMKYLRFWKKNKANLWYVKTVNSLRTNMWFHNKDGISHSLTHSLKTVQFVHIWIIYFLCPLFFSFTLIVFLLSIHIYTGREKALKIIWTLCQYVINRTSQQFTVGFFHVVSRHPV